MQLAKIKIDPICFIGGLWILVFYCLVEPNLSLIEFILAYVLGIVLVFVLDKAAHEILSQLKSSKISKFEEPKIEDVFAWKICYLDKGKLYPAFHHSGHGSYSVLGSNHFLRNKNGIFASKGWSIPKLMVDTNQGYYSFKEARLALQELYSSQILAKVRIWGVVIEGEYGYKSEYFEIVDLYSDYPYFDRVADWPFEIKDFKELETIK